MVGAEDVGVDGGGFNTVHELGGDEEVVEAPADVPVARSALDVPIAIRLFSMRVEMPEGVYVASGYDLVDPCALLGEKDRIPPILLGPRQIYLSVGGVHVAAENNRLLLL